MVDLLSICFLSCSLVLGNYGPSSPFRSPLPLLVLLCRCRSFKSWLHFDIEIISSSILLMGPFTVHACTVRLPWLIEKLIVNSRRYGNVFNVHVIWQMEYFISDPLEHVIALVSLRTSTHIRDCVGGCVVKWFSKQYAIYVWAFNTVWHTYRMAALLNMQSTMFFTIQ